jgi:colicin import membrane protein
MRRLADDLERAADLGDDPREAVRKLAREQEKLEVWLTDEAAKVAVRTTRELLRAVEEITRGQEAVSKAIDALPVPPRAVRQRREAGEHAEAAARAMKRRDSLTAHGEMQLARQALEALASLMPTPEERHAAGEKAADSPDRRAARAQAEKARALAKDQRDLRDELRRALDGAPTGDAAKQLAAQRAAQEKMAQQAGELAKGLDEAARGAGSPQAKEMATQAAARAREAQAAMARAAAEGKEAQERAAMMLAQAAERAEQAAGQMEAKAGSGESKEGQAAGKAVAEGQAQADRASMELGEGQPGPASQSMAKAAQALQQAASQAAARMTRDGQKPGPASAGGKLPNPMGSPGGGPPDPRAFARELEKHTGKTWGQLPGELQTRILQDVRGRYGEDYATIIQRYFEAIADTQRK